jgi:hypothetical protein
MVYKVFDDNIYDDGEGYENKFNFKIIIVDSWTEEERQKFNEETRQINLNNNMPERVKYFKFNNDIKKEQSRKCVARMELKGINEQIKTLEQGIKHIRKNKPKIGIILANYEKKLEELNLKRIKLEKSLK